MRTSAFLYPWDVVGDPDAPARIADLGIQQVTLAAAYHSTRALTPRHPTRRIVTAEHAAVLYPPDSRPLGGAGAAPVPAGVDRLGRPVRGGRRSAGRCRARRAQLGGPRAQLPARRGTPGHLGGQRLRGPLPVGALRRPAGGPRVPGGPGGGGGGTRRGAGHRAGVLRLVRLRPSARPRQGGGRRARGRRPVPDVPLLLRGLPGRVRRTGPRPRRAGRGRAPGPGAGLVRVRIAGHAAGRPSGSCSAPISRRPRCGGARRRPGASRKR